MEGEWGEGWEVLDDEPPSLGTSHQNSVARKVVLVLLPIFNEPKDVDGMLHLRHSQPEDDFSNSETTPIAALKWSHAGHNL